tara:strand:- start:749 stop:922 length:174 start_codon:yes stop_codon:yes gene_type:complete
MCLGDGCLKKATCHRFTAKPNPYRQAYFSPTPNKDGECEYYWEVEKKLMSKPIQTKG